MELQNERDKCADRPYGFYSTRTHRGWQVAEFTKSGWKAEWSGWYQNDSDFQEICEAPLGEHVD